MNNNVRALARNLVENTTTTVATLLQVNEDLQRKSDEKERQNASLKKEVGVLGQQLEEKTEELDDITGQLEKKTKELDDITGQLEKKTKELDVITGQLEQKTEELDDVMGKWEDEKAALNKFQKKLAKSEKEKTMMEVQLDKLKDRFGIDDPNPSAASSISLDDSEKRHRRMTRSQHKEDDVNTKRSQSSPKTRTRSPSTKRTEKARSSTRPPQSVHFPDDAKQKVNDEFFEKSRFKSMLRRVMFDNNEPLVSFDEEKKEVIIRGKQGYTRLIEIWSKERKDPKKLTEKHTIRMSLRHHCLEVTKAKEEEIHRWRFKDN